MAGGQKRIFVSKLTDVSSSDLEGVGVIRWEGAKCYKYVKIQNTSATVAGVAGDCVSYGAGTGYTNSVVVLDTTDANDATNPTGAGLLQGTVAGVQNTAYYGWIQIKGPATPNQDLAGTPSNGSSLAASATDKVLKLQLYAGTTPNIVAVGARVGVVMIDSANLIACDFPF